MGTNSDHVSPFQMCEQQMKKEGVGGNVISQSELAKRLANQRAGDGDDTGSDDDRMVICENQDDSSE